MTHFETMHKLKPECIQINIATVDKQVLIAVSIPLFTKINYLPILWFLFGLKIDLCETILSLSENRSFMQFDQP